MHRVSLAVLLVVALAAPVSAGEDPLRAAEVQRLVWAAVDAPDGSAAHAYAELHEFPAVAWRDVYDVLAAGRPADLREPLATPPEELAAHLEELSAFDWEPGVVRTFDLGDPSWWYTIAPAPDAFETDPPAVLFDFGAFAPQAVAPPGWIVVRLHDALFQATDLGGAPLSLTAGTTSQSIVLSVLRDLERRVAYDPDRVFLTGFSRGGNAALYFGVHWPDRFAGIVPASGYYPFADGFLPNLGHVAVLAAYGDDRGHRDANAYQAALVPRLEKIEADVVARPQAGRATDGKFGHEFLAWAAKRRRDPLPRKLKYVLTDPRHSGAYWVEILEVKSKGKLRPVAIGAPGGGIAETFRVHGREASVEVEVTGPNEIRVRARNVKRMRLLLSPELFDLEAPVVIGSVKMQAPPLIRTLIDEFRRTHDSRRLFPAVVELSF